MNLMADESVDAPIVHKLRQHGYEVFSIAEQLPGISDEQVLTTAFEQNALLITQDKDFGELVYRLGKAHQGIILLRLAYMAPAEKARLCLEAVNRHKDELPGSFTVIFKEVIKIRKSR